MLNDFDVLCFLVVKAVVVLQHSCEEGESGGGGDIVSAWVWKGGLGGKFM